MRINPKSLLQGLLYLTPVTLLALASCGGGGGGGSSATLAAYYTLSVSVTAASGVTNPASGVQLHNGPDTLTYSAPATKTFATSVLSGSYYNISVLSQPTTTPPQVCTFSNGKTSLSAAMPAANTTVGMNCVTGYTIGGTVSGLTGTVVLQNNGGDNLVVSAIGSFTFPTPVASGKTYDVTVLTNPPGQSCTLSNNTGTVASTNITSVGVTCANLPATPTPDAHAYVANSGSNNLWAYTLSAGVPTGHTVSSAPGTAGMAPSAIAVLGGKYAFVTNRSSNTVSAYPINASGVMATSPVATTATGSSPTAIAVHPSGKFAYVVNQVSNSISAYSIDPTTGALASIDADASTAGTQAAISTKAAFIPVAIAINPAGTYAYVASLGNTTYSSNSCGGLTTGCITAYQIDQTTGALTFVPVAGTGDYIATGNTPSSIAVGANHVYVTNQADDSVSAYPFAGSGQLNSPSPVSGLTGGTGPSSIALNPNPPTYGYVVFSSSNNVWVFDRSTLQATGAAKPTGGTSSASISVDSTGQYAYVANTGSNSITVFNISGSGSAVSSVSCTGVGCAGSNFAAGTNPVSVATSP